MLVPIVSVLAVFGTIFGIAYLHYTSRNRERLALIDKGVDASIFYSADRHLDSLRIGMLLVGVGVGILLGYFVSANFRFEEGVAYPSMIALTGGLSLILFYQIQKRSRDKEEQKHTGTPRERLTAQVQE
jgi:hypothetical protein